MRLSNASKLVESLVILLAGAWLLLIATPALAVFTQCPAIGADTGCGILITINADGSTTVVADPANGPYDGSEDTLVGLQNNSASTVSTIHLSSTTAAIFGFDGDGICGYLPAACNPADPSGYGGPGVTFSGISGAADAGDVNFSPGIPPNGSAYFSLEESLTAASFNAGPPPPPLVVPTLSQWGLMMLIGLMLVVGLARYRRR